jgi:hypothetical protein
VKLKENQAAPFDGVLVTESKLIELDKAQRSNIVLKDLGLAKDELIDIHKEDARTQRRKLSEAKFESYLNVLGAFVVGVLVTGFAFKVNQKIGDI